LREWPRLIVSEILAPEVRRRDRGQTRHATAMKRIATLIGSMLLLSMGLVRDARAQATGNADVTLLPSQGLYWNPREHGIYYHLSVGPDGYGFVAITLFRPDGEPTFLEPISKSSAGRARSPEGAPASRWARALLTARPSPATTHARLLARALRGAPARACCGVASRSRVDTRHALGALRQARTRAPRPARILR
jgi:hypothetical protein